MRGLLGFGVLEEISWDRSAMNWLPDSVPRCCKRCCVLFGICWIGGRSGVGPWFLVGKIRLVIRVR